jgi:hypothetical protein
VGRRCAFPFQDDHGGNVSGDGGADDQGLKFRITA